MLMSPLFSRCTAYAPGITFFASVRISFGLLSLPPSSQILIVVHSGVALVATMCVAHWAATWPMSGLVGSSGLEGTW